MGGVIMLIAVIGTVVLMDYPSAQTCVLLGAILLIGGLGLVDDASKVIRFWIISGVFAAIGFPLYFAASTLGF